MEYKIKYIFNSVILFCIFLFTQYANSQEYLNILRPGAVELNNLRGYNSKTFINIDNSYTTLIFPYNKHYFSYGNFEENSTDNTTLVDVTRNTVRAYSSYHEVENNAPTIKFGFNDPPRYTMRSYVYWNMTDVPVYANISEVRVTWYRSFNASTTTFYLKTIDNFWGPTPSNQQGYDLWQDCGNGVTYASFNGISGNQVFTSNNSQNTAFKTDLVNRLPDRWMACAFVNSDETNASNSYGMSGGYMAVDWTAPADVCIGNITINNGQTLNYQVSNSITVPCNSQYFIINSGGTSNMEAGSYILIKEGFHAKTGCFYSAKITGSDDGDVSLTSNILQENIAKKNTSNQPTIYSLSQNYPNPFNPTTLIQYGLKENVRVKITIFDILGRNIKTLVNENQDAGYNSVMWDGTNNFGAQVATGVYIYKIEAGRFVDSKKMLLIK